MPPELRLEIMDHLVPEDQIHLRLSCRNFYDIQAIKKLGEYLLSCSKCRTRHTKECFTTAMLKKDADHRICKAHEGRLNVLPNIWLDFTTIQDLTKTSTPNGGRVIGINKHAKNCEKSQELRDLELPARYHADSHERNVDAWAESAIHLDQGGRVSVET